MGVAGSLPRACSVSELSFAGWGYAPSPGSQKDLRLQEFGLSGRDMAGRDGNCQLPPCAVLWFKQILLHFLKRGAHYCWRPTRTEPSKETQRSGTSQWVSSPSMANGGRGLFKGSAGAWRCDGWVSQWEVIGAVRALGLGHFTKDPGLGSATSKHTRRKNPHTHTSHPYGPQSSKDCLCAWLQAAL